MRLLIVPKTGYAICADFKKCFDLISYSGIRGSLRYFGIGEGFIQMVNLLLNNFQACVANNGYLSDFFGVTRSCHQGCPAAPSLMLICAEVMAHTFKQNLMISPYYMSPTQSSELISQFADDTQLFSKDKTESVDGMVNTFEVLRKNIGFTINFEKTTIHPLGGTEKHEKLGKFQWDAGYPYLLGVDTDPDASQIYSILEKAKNVINIWQRRSLSIIGKVLIVNSLVASLFVYVLQCTVTPDVTFFDMVDKMIRKFLWNNKRDKIKLVLLQADRKLGGLNLVNLREKCKALKIAWIFRENGYVQEVLASAVPESLGTLFWDCCLYGKHVKLYVAGSVPRFWMEVIWEWFEFQRQERLNQCDIADYASQLLWCNSQILVEGQPILFNKCVDSSLLYVRDLIGNDGKTKSYLELSTNYCITWWEYVTIVHAIPNNWKKAFHDKDLEWAPWPTTLYEQIGGTPKKVKCVYGKLMAKKRNEVIDLHQRVVKSYQVKLDEYQEALTVYHQTTNIVKYHSFQYRLLTGAIYANDRLFYWGKKPSRECEWCDCKKQSTKHMLFSCNYVIELWLKLAVFVKFCLYGVNETLDWSVKARFCGKVHSAAGHIVNFLVLLCKQYIYARKCLGKKIDVRDFFKTIDKMYRTERYIANTDGKRHYHNVKWAPFTGFDPPNKSNKSLLDANPSEDTETLAMHYLMDHGVT